MRFKYLKSSNQFEKDYKKIDIPEKLTNAHFKFNYKLFVNIYHIGESMENGHYFAKRLRLDGVETYDDSRYHFNSNEKI